MRYFVRDLQIAIVESPLTAQAARRYATWHEVDRATLCAVWSCRDRRTLALATEAARRRAPVVVVEAGEARAVGHVDCLS